jgi:hypothetical protein
MNGQFCFGGQKVDREFPASVSLCQANIVREILFMAFISDIQRGRNPKRLYRYFEK